MLSKIFHIGTQDLRENTPIYSYTDFFFFFAVFKHKIAKNRPAMNKKLPGQVITLPDVSTEVLEKISLLEVLKKRKTCRNFYGKPIGLDKVSCMLKMCFGINPNISDEHAQRRFSPAGGALQASEGYLVSVRIQGLDPGIYYYDFLNHRLVVIQKIDLIDKISFLLKQQGFSEQLSFGIFVTSRFDKWAWKYKHSKVYRAALLDIGHISQNFQLIATALQIDPWLTAAMEDSQINQLLQLDNVSESVMFFLGGGIGNHYSYDKQYEAIM